MNNEAEITQVNNEEDNNHVNNEEDNNQVNNDEQKVIEDEQKVNNDEQKVNNDDDEHEQKQRIIRYIESQVRELKEDCFIECLKCGTCFHPKYPNCINDDCEFFWDYKNSTPGGGYDITLDHSQINYVLSFFFL